MTAIQDYSETTQSFFFNALMSEVISLYYINTWGNAIKYFTHSFI